MIQQPPGWFSVKQAVNIKNNPTIDHHLPLNEPNIFRVDRKLDSAREQHRSLNERASMTRAEIEGWLIERAELVAERECFDEILEDMRSKHPNETSIAVFSQTFIITKEQHQLQALSDEAIKKSHLLQANTSESLRTAQEIQWQTAQQLSALNHLMSKHFIPQILTSKDTIPSSRNQASGDAHPLESLISSHNENLLEVMRWCTTNIDGYQGNTLTIEMLRFSQGAHRGGDIALISDCLFQYFERVFAMENYLASSSSTSSSPGFIEDSRELIGIYQQLNYLERCFTRMQNDLEQMLAQQCQLIPVDNNSQTDTTLLEFLTELLKNQLKCCVKIAKNYAYTENVLFEELNSLNSQLSLVNKHIQMLESLNQQQQQQTQSRLLYTNQRPPRQPSYHRLPTTQTHHTDTLESSTLFNPSCEFFRPRANTQLSRNHLLQQQQQEDDKQLLHGGQCQSSTTITTTTPSRSIIATLPYQQQQFSQTSTPTQMSSSKHLHRRLSSETVIPPSYLTAHKQKLKQRMEDQNYTPLSSASQPSSKERNQPQTIIGNRTIPSAHQRRDSDTNSLAKGFPAESACKRRNSRESTTQATTNFTQISTGQSPVQPRRATALTATQQDSISSSNRIISFFKSSEEIVPNRQQFNQSVPTLTQGDFYSRRPSINSTVLVAGKLQQPTHTSQQKYADVFSKVILFFIYLQRHSLLKQIHPLLSGCLVTKISSRKSQKSIFILQLSGSLKKLEFRKAKGTNLYESSKIEESLEVSSLSRVAISEDTLELINFQKHFDLIPRDKENNFCQTDSNRLLDTLNWNMSLHGEHAKKMQIIIETKNYPFTIILDNATRIELQTHSYDEFTRTVNALRALIKMRHALLPLKGLLRPR